MPGKVLIRKQAVASAKTQSHVIEVLSAIQTVKAQNVEMVSRWKWQDRYQDVVEQGFKALTVGVVSGQVGNNIEWIVDSLGWYDSSY